MNVMMIRALSAGLMLACAAGMVWADSKRVRFADNGHVYQRFDGDISWGAAKAACESKDAHLVTLTSEAENEFVFDALINVESGALGENYLIGATDSAVEGNWEWVTGEKWSYTRWLSGQPDNLSRYVCRTCFTFEYQDFGVTGANYGWADTWNVGPNYNSPGPRQGHICEWSKPVAITTISYPDVTGDVRDEALILTFDYQNKKPTLQIHDTAQDSKLARYSFANSKAQAKDVAVLNDQNGDGWREVAVLYYANKLTWLETIDVKNKRSLGKQIVLQRGYLPFTLDTTPDRNKNGVPELVIQGESTKGFNTKKKSLIEVRDPQTQEVLQTLKH